MGRLRYALALVPVWLIFLTAPLYADSACVGGNFSSLVGTTCSVGSLTFIFNGTSSYGGGWNAGDLYFTPATNGFTLSFLGGPQSLTANLTGPPFSGIPFDELGLNFNVIAPQGYYFNGDSVSTSASFGASGGFSAAFPGIIAQSAAGGAGNYEVCGYTQFSVCQTMSAYYPASPPFSSNVSVDAIVFDLYAGNGSAYWDGSPSTFTFSLDNNVPEPATLPLLGIGVLSLIGMALLPKRVAHPFRSPMP
jgi:hypothetical protein